MKLQIKVNDKWFYVFCYSEQNAIVFTYDKNKAITGKHALDYFTNKFANHTFKLGA